MENLETIAVNVYKYARAVENYYQWENCRSPLCEDKRSFGAFERDLIIFITEASDVPPPSPRKPATAYAKPSRTTRSATPSPPERQRDLSAGRARRRSSWRWSKAVKNCTASRKRRKTRR
jgi:hypothetical protein